jgi:hypothetical protein
MLILFSCKKERAKPSWDVDLLLPLISDTLLITDIIHDSLLSENPDESVSLVFESKLYDVNIDSLVKLPDTLFNYVLSMAYIPFEIPFLPGDTLISEIFDWPLDFESFDIQGVKMENATVRTGAIKFDVHNVSGIDLLCEFGIRTAIKNETDTFNISEKVYADQFTEKDFDIAGYNLGMTGINDDTVNTFNYYLAFIVHPDELDTVWVTPADSFSVNIHFIDIVADYAKGYFGQNEFSFGPETYDFDLFEDLNIGGISMEGAKIDLRVENNYGVDGLFSVQELLAINSETNEEIALEGEMVDSNLYIDRGSQIGDGDHIINPFISHFDFSNSNFNDLIAINPDKFSYIIDIETNPTADSMNRNNFFYYDAPISVFMEAELEQGFNIQDMIVENSLSWNGNGIDMEMVESGQIKLVFNNWFPFSFDMNLYLEDKDHIVLDTLLYEEFISGAEPGLEGRVLELVETRTSIVLSDELKLAVKDAKYASYELKINSSTQQQSKLYSDYTMEFKLIGDFKMKLEQ